MLGPNDFRYFLVKNGAKGALLRCLFQSKNVQLTTLGADMTDQLNSCGERTSNVAPHVYDKSLSMSTTKSKM
jgi:hypothetical protein